MHRIEQHDKHSAKKDYVGNIWIDPHTAAVFCNGKEQDFIVFDEHVMLVEKRDDFYERRGIGKLMWAEDGTSRSLRIGNHVEQLGSLGHVIKR